MPKSTLFFLRKRCLLRASVLGDSLGALRHGVLGKFTREEETDSSLDFPGGDGGTLVVVSKAGSFCSNAFEDVIHERVHDGHSLGGNTSVGVDLLEHFVNVDAVALLPPAFLLLVALCNGLLGLTGLLGGLSGGLGWHTDVVVAVNDFAGPTIGIYEGSGVLWHVGVAWFDF